MENNVTQVAFKINGKEHTLDIDNRFTLLDILRDKLNLTGAKKGCDLGECGACTVTLDGKAVNSCQILAVKIASSEIKTIEGLNQGNILHPLQISFIEHDGGQCGYCTPGFITEKCFCGRNKVGFSRKFMSLQCLWRHYRFSCRRHRH
jgi:xanthine dehydrogenase YagT iron-sulfur-binding subunit